jgi:hypothetical protein
VLLTKFGAGKWRANHANRRENTWNFCRGEGEFTKIRQTHFAGTEKA